MHMPKGKPPRVFILVFILILLIGITIVLLPSDPLIAARMSSFQHSHDIEHKSFNPDSAALMDMRIGTILPQVGAGKAIRAGLPHSSTGCLVVGLGNCASCIRFDFVAWQQQSKNLHVPLVGFSGASLQQIADYRRAGKIDAPIYFDVKNTFGQAINSYWNGRVYYFDSNWQLVWRMEGFGNPNDLDKQPDLKKLIESHS